MSRYSKYVEIPSGKVWYSSEVGSVIKELLLFSNVPNLPAETIGFLITLHVI